MNVLPNVANTVANWTFQNTLADSSGNGLNWTVENGGEHYTTIGSLVGFQGQTPPSVGPFNDLLAPSSSLLRFVGEFTIECLCLGIGTTVGTFLQCETPGGAVLWALYHDTGNRMAYADTHVNTFLSPPIDWTALCGAPFVLGFRRRLLSPGVYRVECFVNGVKQSGFLDTTTNVAVGTERLRAFGYVVSANLNSVIGTMRFVAAALPDPVIARDSYYVLGPAVSTDTGIVYDAVAAAQFATALRQSPRS